MHGIWVVKPVIARISPVSWKALHRFFTSNGGTTYMILDSENAERLPMVTNPAEEQLVHLDARNG